MFKKTQNCSKMFNNQNCSKFQEESSEFGDNPENSRLIAKIVQLVIGVKKALVTQSRVMLEHFQTSLT